MQATAGDQVRSHFLYRFEASGQDHLPEGSRTVHHLHAGIGWQIAGLRGQAPERSGDGASVCKADLGQNAEFG